jgi:hypothetical protein
MQRKYLFFIFLSALLATALIAGPPSGGDYVISKSTVDNGGSVSTGGDFVLTGTIGQSDANADTSAGGEYLLAGGFWALAAEPIFTDAIFSDGFEDE